MTTYTSTERPVHKVQEPYIVKANKCADDKGLQRILSLL